MKGKQGRQNKAASVTRAEKQAMAQTLALLDRGVHERAAGCTKEKLDMVRQALTMRNVPRPGPPPDLVLALRDAIAEDAVLIECCNLCFIGQHGSRNCDCCHRLSRLEAAPADKTTMPNMMPTEAEFVRDAENWAAMADEAWLALCRVAVRIVPTLPADASGKRHVASQQAVDAVKSLSASLADQSKKQFACALPLLALPASHTLIAARLLGSLALTEKSSR